MKVINPANNKLYRLGPYTWSDIELGDLAKAWIAISIAFAIVLSGAQMSLNLVTMFIVSGLTVGVGFIFHEMGHKIVAQRYKIWAEFRANYTMLLLAIAMSFLGFVFAAPGAVMIGHTASVKKMGKIAVAGPLMNLALAVVFLAFSIVSPNIITFYGFLINSFLALFNMIPLGMFDGRKILKWNKAVYFGTVVLAAIFVYIAFSGLGA